MRKHLWLSLLLGLSLILTFAGAVGAKLPAGYGNTKGLYVFWDTPEDNINPPDLPIVGGFWRYNWSALEPTNAGYNWGTLDNWILKEQQRGKLVGIGFSFFNKYSASGADRGLQIPSWLPGIDSDVRWLNTKRSPETWYIPNYWSTTFRNYYARFIQAFAQHVAQDSLANGTPIRDRVAWVSMGVGLEGETQPACRWNCPGDEPDWFFYNENKGITSGQWVEYVNWCSNTYKQAFSARGLSTPIFVDIGPTYTGGATERDQFSDYAASLGVGLRNNGLKMDRENGVIYEPMKEHWNNVPTAWETYGTPGWLDSRPAAFWGLLCGLAKHPDNFTLDRGLLTTEEYLPLLQFVARYCAVTVADTPGVWVGLRQTQQPGGEQGNSSFWLVQKDDAPSALTQPVWDVGADRRYMFDVPNGSYQVELHFAEIYYSSPGGRIFDIVIEGQTVANNFDIVSAGGGARKPVVRQFATTVADGRLDVQLTPDWGAGSQDYPVVSAIKVTQQGGAYLRRINCGGSSYTDGGGSLWLYDRQYEPGDCGYVGGSTYYDKGADIIGTDDDYLYQTQRVCTVGAPAEGRFARKTGQAGGNRYMRFDVDNGYMYQASSQAVITVTYYSQGSDAWELRYDAASDVNKLAGRVQKDNSGLWKHEVFYITDAYFGNRQSGSTDFYIGCLGDGDETISFVEVSKGGGGPATAAIQGSVTLQGRPAPPSPRWAVPLTVTVGTSNYSVNTDQSGNFTLSGLALGSYDIAVKNGHTLSNIRRNYTLVAGNNTISFGELKEGDASGDDRVNSSDFLLLRGSYFKSSGQPGFVDGADFNEDDVVNSSDFLLLRNNYFQNGPIELSGAQVRASALEAAGQSLGPVSIAIEPQSLTIDAGGTFDLDVRVDAGAEGVAAADVFINFDPSDLQVVEIEDGETLSVFAKPYDNVSGTIDIGAGTLNAPVGGSFVLATLHLQARDSAQGATSVTFSLTDPRRTVVKDAGDHDLLGTPTNGTVQIEGSPQPSYSVYLPLVVR